VLRVVLRRSSRKPGFRKTSGQGSGHGEADAPSSRQKRARRGIPRGRPDAHEIVFDSFDEFMTKSP